MKSKLLDEDKCILINGEIGYVNHEDILLEGSDRFLYLENFNEDLTRKNGDQDFSVIRVIREDKIIWERSNALDEIADMSYEIDVILAGFENQLGDWEDAKRARELLLDLVCKIKEI